MIEGSNVPKPEVLVQFKKLSPTATIPRYQTAGAAGLDLHADGIDGLLQLMPGVRVLVWCGLSMAIPAGYEGQVRSRSGLTLKQGLIVLNSPGTIDSDYRGPLGVILYNAGHDPAIIRQGDRIAQLVICPVEQAVVIEVDSLDDTVRGSGGLGSTGV
jgi:dUTP pyrophosphatase